LRLILNIAIKGVILFLLFNFSLGLVPQGGRFGRLSLYNRVFSGRTRLPFGETPRMAYNLSLYDLEVMFSSHEVSAGSKPEAEFRIILIGDSATWGILQKPDQTLSGVINANLLRACDGRTVRAFNLAYPSMSLLKDLMLLEKALSYQPDLIIWPITLQAFPDKFQIATPLVANNPHIAEPLIESYGLSVTDFEDDFNKPSFWDSTLIGRRRKILYALQLQFYGVMWAATGIDQYYPENFTPAQLDFASDDTAFAGWPAPELPLENLSIDIIHAGYDMAGDIPLMLVNEPILISPGENHEIRYNYYYPRSTYDRYRKIMSESAHLAGWHYIDVWNVVPFDQFTNSAVHLTAEGTQIYYEQLLPAIQAEICP
jgi:hypothetical protein